MPLVSVITPSYNAANFIRATLQSVKLQNYPFVEHIVVDDGSTDNTVSIFKEFSRTYNLRWLSKSNEGQAITLNKAFDMARGEIIIWLNADDVLFSTSTINDIVRAFESSQADVVYGHMAIIDEKNKLLKIQYAPPKINLEVLLLGHFAPCICYRKDVFSKYYLRPNYNFAVDYEQCLRMAKDRIRFGYVGKVLLAWRKHKRTKSISGRKKLQTETNSLKEDYGAKFGLNQCWLRFAYYGLLLGRKLYGTKQVVEINAHPAKFQLAFDIQVDHLSSCSIRQAIPYI